MRRAGIVAGTLAVLGLAAGNASAQEVKIHVPDPVFLQVTGLG